MPYFEGEITVDPEPKRRPRFVSRGKFVTAYTDAKTKAYESKIRELLRSAYSLNPCEDWCSLSIVFHLPRPNSVKRKSPTVKPDIDNLAKSFLDAANGILYTDDKILLDLRVCKKYSGVGAISFKLRGE